MQDTELRILETLQEYEKLMEIELEEIRGDESLEEYYETELLEVQDLIEYQKTRIA